MNALTYAERTLVAGDHEGGLIAGLKLDRTAIRRANACRNEFYRARGYKGKPSPILTEPDSQAKLAKSERFALGLMLTPADALPAEVARAADLRAKFTLCSSASAGCRSACLAYSGHGAFTGTQLSRQTRTAFLLSHPYDAGVLIGAQVARAAGKHGADRVTFRYNTLSDIRIEFVAADAFNYASRVLGVRMYDYTAHSPARRDPSLIEGYHLTYSAKEVAHTSDEYLRGVLESGHNVAVPFHVAKGAPLPNRYAFAGREFEVIDGDLTDDRTEDPAGPVGVIVGLRAKGSKGKADDSGFIRTVC